MTDVTVCPVDSIVDFVWRLTFPTRKHEDFPARRWWELKMLIKFSHFLLLVI